MAQAICCIFMIERTPSNTADCRMFMLSVAADNWEVGSKFCSNPAGDLALSAQKKYRKKTRHCYYFKSCIISCPFLSGRFIMFQWLYVAKTVIKWFSNNSLTSSLSLRKADICKCTPFWLAVLYCVFKKQSEYGANCSDRIPKGSQKKTSATLSGCADPLEGFSDTFCFPALACKWLG